jgi:DNA repair protein RadC
MNVPIYQVRLQRAGVLRIADTCCDNCWAAYRLFRPVLRELAHEQVWIAAVNGATKVVGLSMVSQGGLHGAAVTPRDILQYAMLANASAILLAHNHPSGCSKPSAEDIVMTRELARACEAVQIHLLDHLVLADDGFSSMRDLGYLQGGGDAQ